MQFISKLLAALVVVGGCNLASASSLENYNMVLFGDFAVSGGSGHIHGTAFVGGNLSGQNPEFGADLDKSLTVDTLEVAGDLNASQVTVQSGYLAYGGANNLTNINCNGNGLSGGGCLKAVAGLDAKAATLRSELSDESAYYAGLAPNGSVDLSAKRFTYSGSATDLAVFDINGSDLFAQNSNWNLDFGEAAYVVINVHGANLTSAGGINFNGGFSQANAAKILWNFVDADSIDLGATQWFGSILALNASLDTDNDINGTLVANSYIGNGQVHVYNWQYNHPLPNEAPSFTSQPVTSVIAGSVYTYAAMAEDPDQDVLSYRLTEAPAGMLIGPLTGVISWAPSSADEGQHTVTVLVSDEGGLEDQQTYTLNVIKEDLACNGSADPVYLDPFEDLSTLTLNGSTSIVTPTSGAPVLRLTPHYTNQGGSAFTTAPILLENAQGFKASFSTAFSFRITNSGGMCDTDGCGADGLVFVVQTVDNRVGATGGGIGYQGLPNSVGIEFDTWNNGSGDRYNGNHVGIDISGSTNSVVYAPVSTRMNDGDIWYSWVDYDGDRQLLEVRLSLQNERPTDPVLSYNVDLTSVIQQSAAYVGFTSGTGGAYGDHDILSWQFVNDYLPIGDCTPLYFTSKPLQLVALGDSYNYHPSVSGRKLTGLGYELISGPSGMTTDAATGQIQWTPATGDLGIHTIGLRVFNANGDEAKQTFVLLVTESGAYSPKIISAPATEIAGGELFSYQVNAVDNNGTGLTYSIDEGPKGLEFSGNQLIWQTAPADEGAHRVRITVADGYGLSDSQVFWISVTGPNPNHPPVFNSDPITTAHAGVPYLYYPSATDPDGDSIEYRVESGPSGMWFRLETGAFEWLPQENQVGEQAVTVVADDHRGGIATQTYQIQVTLGLNSAPTIASTPVTTASVGTPYSYDVNASDADGDTLSYSLTTAPAGMAIDAASGLISWTPTSAQVGSQAVSVQVDDGNGGTVTQSFSVTVSAASNTAPTIDSMPVTTATEGTVYSYDVNAIDADGNTLSYSLTTAPAGMAIDAASGLISWTPASAQVGSQAVSVQVDDGNGGTASQSFSVAVSAAANAAPSITSTPATQATTNTAYSYAVTASDSDGDALNYTLPVAPSGMSIDSTTGLVSWTPDLSQTGSQAVTVRVDDGQAYVEQSFNITVGSDALPLNVFISLSSQTIDLGDTTTVTVSSEGGLQPATLTLEVDGTPVVLDSAGQATLPASAIGSYQLVATAADTRETVDSRSYYSVRDPADTTLPTAIISTPATDAELTAPVEVIGTAEDANLAEYKLMVSPVDLNQYTDIAHGSTSVVDGVLGSFDPTQLENGIYDVALIVTDVNGQQKSAVVQYQVSGDMKVGNFSFTVQDLSIPVAGIPITVSRTYDTRKRFRNLDFGFGWTVDYQSVKVEENIKLGLNWTQTSSGNILKTYCLDPVGNHVVTVTLPDGKVEKFDLSASPHCNPVYPLETVEPVFTARPGTTSTLVAEDVGALYVNGTTLLDMTSVDTYDPSRYTLTTAEGYVYALDQDFGIRTVTDPNGNTLTYSSSGIVHSSGKSVTFTRDGQSRITRITDPNGNHIDYIYDVNGDLASVTNQVGEVTQHRYNRSHGLTEFIDPRGITPARNIYDDQGRLIATEDADGNRIELTHDVTGRQEVVRDRLGNVTVLGYDDNGFVAVETDALGNATLYRHDERGNELSKTDALGNAITKTFNANDKPLTETDALGNTTTYTYNTRNQLLTTTDKNGNVTSNSYDSRGNLIQITDALGNAVSSSYDSGGNLTALTDEGGNTTAYTYDAGGNQTSEVDPLGSVTTYTYDDNGNQTGDSRSRTDGGTTVTVTTQKVYDAANRLISQVDGEGYGSGTEYNALGKPAAEIDKNGNRTEFDYDSRGNLIRTRYADSTESTATYDAEGNKLSETDQSGNTTSYEYDALKRLVRAAYADGSQVSNSYDNAGRLVTVTGSLGNITRYTYDAVGQRTSVTDALGNVTGYAYDINGNQTGFTDANGNVTQYEYDELNRRTRTIFPDGTESMVSYDAKGRKISETDQAGVATQYGYDALGRLTQVTDAMGGVTRYTYDEFGNKLTQTDAEGRITLWTYDNVGNVLSRTLPLGQTETFTYDGNGNKKTHTDFNGATVSYSYDRLNRLVLKTYPDASSVAYSYTATGKIASITDSSGTTGYGYDSRDRLIRVDNADGSYLGYAYDANGNRTELTTPAGTVHYIFDALNRLETVEGINGGITVYAYDAVGNRASVGYPNGTQANYSYDSLNRLTYLENLRSGGSVISSHAYTLGASGNRKRIVEHDGRTVDYSYDDLYRLTRETVTDLVNGNSEVAYSYDMAGNRLSKTVDSVVTVNYSYDANDRLITEGSTSYTYDTNGNTLSKNDGSLTAYSYDVENRLVRAQTPTHTMEYSYDADGIRQAVSVDGVITKHLVDKNRDYAQVIEERDASNNLEVTYTYGDDLISQTRPGNISFYHYDGLGSARALTDGSEVTTDSYTYGAFGQLVRSTGTTPNSYLYTGEQFDPNAGFYYLRARYMNPENGRFTTFDSFQGFLNDPSSLHKYLYASGNPVENIDPTGHFSMVSVSVGICVSGILNVGINYDASAGFKGIAKNFAIGALEGAMLQGVGGVAIKLVRFIRPNAVSGAIAKVFARIRAIGPPIPNASIPLYFEFRTRMGSVLVASSVKDGAVTGAFKHIMAEILKQGGSASHTKFAEALALEELEGAISLAILQGVKNESKMIVKTQFAEWELVFDTTGAVPRLFHAIARNFKVN